MVKLSDYFAHMLSTRAVDTVFGYQGSSVSHLIDSLSRHERISFVETRHEQAAAFAANGYALASGKMGVALSCSGPGATNLISGIANAYYDSLPCLFLTGQVSVREMKTDRDMRQLGFQETDVVSLVKPITKYAVTIEQPDQIAYELEKAMFMMLDGRPGPVLLDIPHNIQGSEVDPSILHHFTPHKSLTATVRIETAAAQTALQFMHSCKPVILLGGGSRALKQKPELIKFLCNLGIPIVSSYRGKDVIDNHIPSYCGTLGVYGDRCANWAIKYCDYLLVLGSRLDGRQTGDGQESFAPNTKVTVVDLDPVELRNMPDRYIKINENVTNFISVLLTCTIQFSTHNTWLDLIQQWRMRYSDEQEYHITEQVNPNLLLKRISAFAAPDAIFSVDVGQNQLWANTSLRVGEGQHLLQSCGLGAMGFALPAAIGGYYSGKKQAICICGDGGFQMNLQELQTAISYHIPLKIFILNNQSLGLIRVYQDKALGKRHFGSVIGFGSPDYQQLAKAYGIRYAKICNNEFAQTLAMIFSSPETYLVEVLVSPHSTNYPEPTYLSTIDNQSKELSAEEKKRVMEEAYGITSKKQQ